MLSFPVPLVDEIEAMELQRATTTNSQAPESKDPYKNK
jgi:hypothetical protein